MEHYRAHKLMEIHSSKLGDILLQQKDIILWTWLRDELQSINEYNDSYAQRKILMILKKTSAWMIINQCIKHLKQDGKLFAQPILEVLFEKADVRWGKNSSSVRTKRSQQQTDALYKRF